MNNIESLKEVITEIGNRIRSSSDELNNALSGVGIHEVDLSNAITRIEKQVTSAESKFTIAFIGTFSTGKSTIINSLLDLKGEARLSNAYDRDTARCVRIIQKAGRKYEAEVDFGGTYPVEKLSWIEAKRYTSHVELEAASEITRERAKYITEVRYYVDSPLLDLCNILDLPGTGSGSEEGSDDEIVTNEKIMESDCFFWVVTTEYEPDPDTLRNLDKISSKMLPIINVWQSEKDDIKGQFTPQEIIQILQDSYSAYLQNAEDPVIYYAKEIDDAQQAGTEVKPEWGKDDFVQKVQQILGNIQTGDRAKRIRKNLLDSFTECNGAIADIRSNKKLAELQSEVNKDKSENAKQFQRLERCNYIISIDRGDAAKKTADDIVDIISDASQSFIQTKMSGFDLKNMLRMFTKKQRAQMSAELTEEFKNNYLRFDTGWLDECVKGFCRDIINILKSKYIDFSSTLNDGGNIELGTGFSSGDMTSFIDDIAEQIQKDAQAKMVSLVSSALTVTLLFVIPGFALIDEIASIFSIGKSFGDLSNDSNLRSKINMVVSHAKVQIRQQRYTIVSELDKQSEDIANQFYEKVKNQLDKDKSLNKLAIEKVAKVTYSADYFESVIEQAEKEIKNSIGG